MRYMFILHECPDEIAERTDPAKADAYWTRWRDYFALVRKSDPDHSGAALQPVATATTIRAGVIEDGPYAETREQLGGFFIADLANLDDALALARACPAAEHGAVEVRPVQSTDGKGG